VPFNSRNAANYYSRALTLAIVGLLELATLIALVDELTDTPAIKPEVRNRQYCHFRFFADGRLRHDWPQSVITSNRADESG